MALTTGLLGSRVARRLFALFLAAALLPLALSAWFSTHAVDGVAQQLGERALLQGTRQVSLQVLDRLLAAKALLASWPRPREGELRVDMPGQGRVFSRVLSPSEQGLAPPGHDARLLAQWRDAAASATGGQPVRDGAGEVHLRVCAGPAPQVLMAVGRADAPRWLAEVNPEYLWSPVADVAVASGWRVHGVAGQTLFTAGEPALVPPVRTAHAGSAAVAHGQAWTRLFLGAEFAAADWVFAQAEPGVQARLLGLPLAGWLAAVAGGSVLLVALASLGQIRRTLLPLGHLTAVTRRLSAGDTAARASVPGGDEFGLLAQAFNEMADRLAQQLGALSHQALHDGLTGLANGRGLQQGLQRLLAQGQPGAVLMLDLDHFKDVNDTFGHEAGDEVLRQAADRLRGCLPDGALVARPGGDEFVLLLPAGDEAAAQRLAAEVLRLLALPFGLRQGDQVLGASVGIALAPAHGRDPVELLRHADLAMYAAKRDGRGCCRVFDHRLDTQSRERLALLAELRQAVARGEFVAHYQPRIRPADGGVTSAEALVRWRHPTRGLVMPGGFIGLAEESGLVEQIGLQMLDQACAQMARWRTDGVALPRVSVNVSPRQLAGGLLPDQVRAALERHQVPAAALELEITESLLVGDARHACEQLAELRRWGVSIALDDFGTGYSSMATLRQLPVDVMKIDRAFVKDLGGDAGALAVTRAIVSLARTMGLHLVAEGIETQAQADILRGLGCDELQGFLYARALPPEEFALLPGLRLPAHGASGAPGRCDAVPT